MKDTGMTLPVFWGTGVIKKMAHVDLVPQVTAGVGWKLVVDFKQGV